MNVLIIIIFIISIFNFSISLLTFLYGLSKLIKIIKLKNKIRRLVENETKSNLFELQ